jgi:hypothetical protein
MSGACWRSGRWGVKLGRSAGGTGRNGAERAARRRGEGRCGQGRRGRKVRGAGVAGADTETLLEMFCRAGRRGLPCSVMPAVPGGLWRLDRGMGRAGVRQLHPRRQYSGTEQEHQHGRWGAEAVEEPHGGSSLPPTASTRQSPRRLPRVIVASWDRALPIPALPSNLPSTSTTGFRSLHRSPAFRVLWSLLTLVFVAGAGLAGRPHGCAAEGSRVLRPVEPGAAEGHSAHGPARHHPEQPVPAECNCVDHACCSSAVLTVLTGDRPPVVRPPECAVPAGPAAPAHWPLPPSHRLPFPLGPPLPLS